MKQSLIKHGKSALLTFASVLGVELYAVMQNADTWNDVGWAPALAAATFTAARSVLKLMISFQPKES